MISRIFEYVFKYISIQSLVLFALVLALHFLFFRQKRRLHDIPGPKPWPLVGNLPSLDLHSERKLLEWHKEFGPVIRIKMPSNEFIALGSIEAVQEAFVKKAENFSNRIQGIIPGISGNDGIIFTDYGTKLKEQRRFALTALREFGMGRRSIEPSIIEKCSELCDKIEKYCENKEAFTINQMIYETVSSIISKLVFNKNLAHEKEWFREFLREASDGPKHFALNGLMVFFPVLKKIPPFSWIHQETNKREKEFMKNLQEQIDEHRQTSDPNAPRDFIDCFLNELDHNKNSERAEELGYTDIQLIAVARDLFLGGSDTTSNAICWIILYLSRYQEVQSTMYNEIFEVLGNEKSPSMSICDKMPYSRAVIQEMSRLRPIAPISLGHSSVKEDTIMGYRIPKGSMITANIFGFHNDEDVWKNPEKFDPTRHIDENGKFIKSQKMITFSVGARQCLGIQLASMELFLITVSIFQKYKFDFAGDENMDMRGKNIFNLKSYPFKVIASKR